MKHMLDALDDGGIGVAIIPIGCVIAPHKAKDELLKSHTLKAVMSMPSELFSPVGTVTCIVVFEAHKPHYQIEIEPLENKPICKPFKKTWFGYWRDDGFIKTKQYGRVDANENWSKIRDRWIESYRNNEVHAGESVTAYVTPDDEWVAEAYIETDYSKLTRDDFGKAIKKLALYNLMLDIESSAGSEGESDEA